MVCIECYKRVTKTPPHTWPRNIFYIRCLPSPSPLSQDVCEEVAHDSGPPPEALQVHGPAAPLHQALLPRGLPPGAAALQHLRRRHQPRPNVRLGGRGGPLWQVGLLDQVLSLLKAKKTP